MQIMKRFVRSLILKTHLSNQVRHELLAWLSYSGFAHGIRSAAKIPHTYNARNIFWSHVLERIGSSEPVLFLEFGVYRGESIRWFARNFCNSRSVFIGFDTFLGLPEKWEIANMPTGTFSCNSQVPLIDDSRVRFEKGVFAETLPKAIQEIQELARGRVVLVHFDADLFSSTLFVLAFLWQRLERYYFLFDEFFGEESWALSDFVQSHPCQVEFFSRDDSSNRCGFPTPNRVFGRILVANEASSLLEPIPPGSGPAMVDPTTAVRFSGRDRSIADADH